MIEKVLRRLLLLIMKNNNLKPYFKYEDFTLYYGDSFKILKKIEEKSIDMIFADPPYFLSSENGISCHSGKQVSVKNTIIVTINTNCTVFESLNPSIYFPK